MMRRGEWGRKRLVLLCLLIGFVVVWIRSCHPWGIGVVEMPLAEYPSPSGARKAAILERDPQGFLVASRFIVRVSGVEGSWGVGHDGRKVWQAYGIEPLRIEWAGEESLVVVIPTWAYRHYAREKLHEWPIVNELGIRTLPVEVPDSALFRVPRVEGQR